MSDRFAEVLSDLASLYQAGKDGTVEQRARLFDQIGVILQRSFTPEESASATSGGGLPLGYVQTTWVERVA